MSERKVWVLLCHAPDETTEPHGQCGRDLARFEHDLERAGIAAWWPERCHGPAPGIDYVLTLGPPLIAAAAATLGAFVQARFGRKVRLKMGDVEDEARTPDEVKTLLEQVTGFRAEQSKAAETAEKN